MPYKNREDDLAQQRRYYAEHREEKLARTRANRPALRDRKRQLVNEHKAKPCADCGIEYPYYVMQFDHVRGEKVDKVNRMVASLASDAALLAEIAKCEVVCANCHAERTYQRVRGPHATLVEPMGWCPGGAGEVTVERRSRRQPSGARWW